VATPCLGATSSAARQSHPLPRLPQRRGDRPRATPLLAPPPARGDPAARPLHGRADRGRDRRAPPTQRHPRARTKGRPTGPSPRLAGEPEASTATGSACRPPRGTGGDEAGLPRVRRVLPQRRPGSARRHPEREVPPGQLPARTPLRGPRTSARIGKPKRSPLSERFSSARDGGTASAPRNRCSRGPSRRWIRRK